jgi:hypothetical protein
LALGAVSVQNRRDGGFNHINGPHCAKMTGRTHHFMPRIIKMVDLAILLLIICQLFEIMLQASTGGTQMVCEGGKLSWSNFWRIKSHKSISSTDHMETAAHHGLGNKMYMWK